MTLTDQAPEVKQAPPRLPTCGLRTDGRDFQLESALLAKSTAQAVNELTVGRRASQHPPPDIDLTDVPNGRTVSRQHAVLTRRDDEWFLRVEAGSFNPTQVDGQTIAPGEQICLTDGQQIQLGGVALAFYEPNPVQIVDDDTIGLSLEPTEIWVAPGSAREVVVTLANFTNNVDSFRVEALGLPFSWYQLVLPLLASDNSERSPDVAALERVDLRLFQTQARGAPASDAVGQVHILFTPPRTSTSLAGEHPFTVRVTSRATRLRRELRAKLILEPFRGLALQQLPLAAPPRVHGTYEWQVQNTGNAASVAELTARAGPVREGALAVQLALLPMDEQTPEQEHGPGAVAFVWDAEHLELQPGARQLARLGVKVRHQQWWGELRTYPFMITATSDTVSVSDRGYLHCPPRVSPRLQALLGWIVGRWPFLLVVLVLILLILPAQLDLTIADRIVSGSGKVAQRDRVTEVAAGDEVWIKLEAARAASETVDGAVYDHLPEPIACQWDLGPFEITGNVCEYWAGSIRWLPQYPLQNTRYVVHGNNVIGLPSGGADWPMVVHPEPVIDAFESSASIVSREGEAIKLKWKLHAAPNDDMRVYLRRLERKPGQTPNAALVDQTDPCAAAGRTEGKNRLLFEGMWFDAKNGGLIASLRNVCHWALAFKSAQIVVGNLPRPLPIRATAAQVDVNAPLRPGEVLSVCTCGLDAEAEQALGDALRQPGTTVTLQTADGSNVAWGLVADQVYPPTDTAGALDSEFTVQPQAAITDYLLEAWSHWSRIAPTIAKRTITVSPPTIDVLSATPIQAVSGGQVRLQWSVKGATELILFGSTGADDDGDRLADSDTAGLLTSDGWSVSVPTVSALTEYWLTLVANNVATRDGVAPRVVKKVRISLVSSQTFFRAEPDSLTVGDATTLIWQADQALAVRVDPGVGDVPPGPGRAQLKPTASTDFTLLVTGLDGVQTRKTVQVHVQPLPEPTPAPTPPSDAPSATLEQASAAASASGPPKIDFFQATPSSIEAGQTTLLVFGVHAAQRVTVYDVKGKAIARLDGASGVVVSSVEVAPAATTVFALTASGLSGDVTQPVTIDVRPAPAPPPEP